MSFLRRLRELLAHPFAPIAAVVVLAVATRLYQLGTESLWLDEAITFHRSKLPLRELVADAWKTFHNPAYFVFMHYFMMLGDDEFMLRLPSAFFGVLTILFAYAMGRNVAGTWAGLGTGLVLCLNPKAVEYDQEARMYAAYSLGAAVAMYGVVWLFSNPSEAGFPVWRLIKDRLARASHRGAARAWLAIFAGSVVALYCHATAVLFVTACSIVALVFIAVRPERKGFVLNWSVVNLLVIFCFLPWLPSLFTQSEEIVQKGFWIPEPTLQRVLNSIGAVFFFRAWRFLWFSWVLLGFALVGSFALRKKPLILAALWLFALLGPALLLVAGLRQPIFMPRLFLWSAIPVAVVVGVGLTTFPWPAMRSACLLAFLGVAGFTLYRGYYVATTKPRWRDAVQLLSNVEAPDVKIVAIARREKRLLNYYVERRTDPIAAFEYTALESTSNTQIDRAIAGARTVWTVQGRAMPMADEARKKLKERGARLDQHKSFGDGVVVESYAMKSKP